MSTFGLFTKNIFFNISHTYLLFERYFLLLHLSLLLFGGGNIVSSFGDDQCSSIYWRTNLLAPHTLLCKIIISCISFI